MNQNTTAQACLDELRQSGLLLNSMIECKLPFDVNELELIHSTIGQITYISESLELAIFAQDGGAGVDVSDLVMQSGLLSSLVSIAFSDAFVAHTRH